MASVQTSAGIFTAEVNGNRVAIYRDGGWIGEGYWENSKLDLWQNLLQEEVRLELEGKLREATFG